MQPKKKRKKFSYYMANVGITGLVLFAILPLIWTFYISLREEKSITRYPTMVTIKNLSFVAYTHIWRDTNFPILIRNSLIVSTMTVAFEFALWVLRQAMPLSRAKFRGRQGVLLSYLVIRLIPGVLLLIPIYIMMYKFHLLDTYFGLTFRVHNLYSCQQRFG
jgi:multiple sugar transport system permease protein